jgi:D-arabinose 1-dehydrogenase-like Zn-dependent alcohol dehydrogenase
MSANTDYKFEGWVGLSAESVKGQMHFQSFEPKKWDEDDVDVRVQYCGICGSDVSALSGEWGPVPKEPCGHEVVGEVVKVGSKVENGLKVGDLVGIGAQSDSCHECESCKSGEENFCQKQVSRRCRF